MKSIKNKETYYNYRLQQIHVMLSRDYNRFMKSHLGTITNPSYLTDNTLTNASYHIWKLQHIQVITSRNYNTFKLSQKLQQIQTMIPETQQIHVITF